MPTLFRIFGLRFFFYSDEHLPVHVHVENGDGNAKIVMLPEIKVEYNPGMKPRDLRNAVEYATLLKDKIINTWDEYFD